MKKFLSVALVIAATQAAAQTPCQDLDAAIESSLKLTSIAYVEGLADNSAPRATLRGIETNNQLQLVGMHLDLMALNKCPTRKAPIDPNKYLIEASKCIGPLAKESKDSAVCDSKKWVGGAGK